MQRFPLRAPRALHSCVPLSSTFHSLRLSLILLSNRLGSYRNHTTFSSVSKSLDTEHTKAGSQNDDPASSGNASALPTNDESLNPYYLLTGHAVFAKRPSRPFPPPFLSLPSSSFSDPLSTHNRSVDKRRKIQYKGEPIRGVTSGDDAILAAPRMVAVADGVGAWAQKERGHAAYANCSTCARDNSSLLLTWSVSLWSRLILHFWSVAASQTPPSSVPAPARNLQAAYEATKQATAPPNEWFGTTTASGAILSTADANPALHITQLGDSVVIVLRPSNSAENALIYKTEEQWHWFDCPRQLGTNSPDTPEENAVTDVVQVQEGDVVVAMSDGVSDNLWIHEVVESVRESLHAEERALQSADAKEAVTRVAAELVRAARVIAEDPFAESPFMERAVEEGLATEGGRCRGMRAGT